MKCKNCGADLKDNLGYFTTSEVRYHLFIMDNDLEFELSEHEYEPFGKLYCENCGNEIGEYNEDDAIKILKGEL